MLSWVRNMVNRMFMKIPEYLCGPGEYDIYKTVKELTIAKEPHQHIGQTF